MKTLLLIAALLPAIVIRAEPENLAPKATASASSEYSNDYLAKFAIDGKVPEAECKEDAREAWCINRAKAGDHGEFTLEWPQPVTVAEVVYFGRTGQIVEECWKDYEVYLDSDAAPVTKGTFQKIHGPQRVAFASRRVQKLRLKFLNSYTTYNPGASEIAVYASRPTDAQLAQFLSTPSGPSPLTDKLLAGELGFRDILLVKRHPMNLSHVYTYHAEGFAPGGGLHVFTPGPDGGKFRELVATPEGEILDCDLSYDAKEIVFSWKRKGQPLKCGLWQTTEEHCRSVPEENYQVFRINIDGTGLTQLTDGTNHNLNPCWLPDGGIAFISDRKPAYAYCFVTTSPVLYRMERDGSRQRRLSANYLMDFTPSVLNDGRIIYTRWEYVDRPAIPIQSLWSIRPDGTGLAGFYGNRVLDPGTFMQARAIPGTGKVLCLLTSHNGSARGAIGIVDPTRGANAQEAIQNLTPDVNIGHVDAGDGNGIHGPYETPYPIDQHHYLVTNNGHLQLREHTNSCAPVTILRASGGFGFYNAQPVKPRVRPPVIASILPEKPANTSATIHLSDVYQGLEPHVQRGEIKKICVVQEIEKSTFTPLLTQVPGASGYAANTAFGFQFPLVSCGATYAPKKVWGYANVAADGSADFRVPTEVPIYFLALDAAGRAVQRMRTFTHLMPGEEQSCQGCHADRNCAAPQPLPRVAATRRIPQPLEPPEWGVKGFSYREIVQPVLDRYCVRCHNERSAPKDVDLSGDMTDFFNVSYDILARKGTIGERSPGQHGVGVASRQEGRSPYTSWISTINGAEYNIRMVTPKTWGSPVSKLADLILAGHPDTAGKPRFQMDSASQRRIMAWIDLNVPYYPNSRVSYADTMGCRRLYPADLETALKKVAAARCNSCHAQGIPRKFYIRVEKPELNNFLLAPLAKSAGGTEACGQAVFASKVDPDYQAILGAFNTITALMRDKPRDDMLTFRPATTTCRDLP